jgi:hypothetical protein
MRKSPIKLVGYVDCFIQTRINVLYIYIYKRHDIKIDLIQGSGSDCKINELIYKSLN